RPLTIPWAAEHVPAIVESWFLGVETGPALAAVLFGDVSPSGKLPATFPRAVGQIPLYYNHKNTGRPTGPDKYTSKYTDLPVTPLFPFGHGLSYTTFSYSDLRLSSPRITPAGTESVSVTVTNTGSREGVEVVQLYVPHEVASVTRTGAARAAPACPRSEGSRATGAGRTRRARRRCRPPRSTTRASRAAAGRRSRA